jgi:hypothetical protein
MPAEDPPIAARPSAAPAPPPAAPASSWLLLAVAFSPVLIDLARHWAERPWAAYSVVFLPLFWLERRRGPRRRPRPGLGWALLVAALALELVLVAGGLTRVARAALVLGAIGIATLQGRPDLRTTLLLVGFVPIPNLLVSWPSPELEAFWAGLAANALHPLGFGALVEIRNGAATLVSTHGRLPLSQADGGLPAAALLVGLAWYAGCRRRWSVAATLARALPCALLAAPLQVAAIGVAAVVADAGGPARRVLDLLPTVVVTAVGLVAVHRRPPLPPPPEPLTGSSDQGLSSRAP